MFIALGVFLVLVVLVAGAGLMHNTLLRAVTPSGGAQVTRSIRYEAGERGTLDVYAPKDATNAPVVVFFYGGSWQMGNKALYGFVGNALAARGFVTVIPDYHIYPEVDFPAFLKDGARAVAWARANAARFGGDPERLFVMGHSAGAHIAAMLALDPQWLGADGLDPATDIAGLIGLSGPYEFLPLQSPTLIKLFGGANRPETQPINFVTAAAPPALLITGGSDDIVEPRNSAALAASIKKAGGSAREVVYPERGHFGIIMAFIGPLEFLAPVADEVAQFIRATPARTRTHDTPATPAHSRSPREKEQALSGKAAE